MNCPVCDTKLKEQRSASECGTEEECHNCPRCDYVYEFSYGDTLVHVGGKTWGWGYNSDYDTVQAIQEEINREIARQRYGRILATLAGMLERIKSNVPRRQKCTWCDSVFWSRELDDVCSELCRDTQVPF